jgi:uncharacterized membrane protein YraQ (UPF0718 family)
MLITVLLMASVLGLIAGPLLLQLKEDAEHELGAVDGFALVTVGGLAVLHLLPEAFLHGGVTAVGFAVAGLVLPSLIDRTSGHAGARFAALLLLVGLVPHAALESAALMNASTDDALALGLAVAAHRLPVGLILFSMIRRDSNTKWAWAAVMVLVLTTVLGFWTGGEMSSALDGHGAVWLQAMVGGSLLHVVFSHHLHDCTHHDHAHGDECETHSYTESVGHDHDHDGHSHADHDSSVGPDPVTAEVSLHRHIYRADNTTLWPAIGAMVGVAVTAFTLFSTAAHDHGGATMGMLDAFVGMALSGAPMLLAAYVLAALLVAFIPPAPTPWLADGQGFSGAFRGVVFGVPLPISSCGVLPLYKTLIERGVPAIAALGFLVAAPALGLDAFLFSLPLLGVEFTVIRLMAAVVVAVVVGQCVGRFISVSAEAASEEAVPQHRSWKDRLSDGFRFSLVELFDHTMPWVLAGLLLAAWFEPLISDTAFSMLPSQWMIPLCALIAIPVYVCTSGAIPVALVAIHKGLSPGAALTFLLVGPATNIATFRVLSRLHGKPIAWVVVSLVTGAGVAAGLWLDGQAIQILFDLHQHTGDVIDPWAALSVVGLVGLIVASLFRQGPRGMAGQITHPIHEH